MAGRTRPAATRTPPDLTTLNSQEKSATLYFDPARALVQDGPNRDTESIRHLDTADRLAPIRIRNDPVARDLVVTLDRRAPRRRRGAIKRILELNPTHRLVSGQSFGPGFCDSAIQPGDTQSEPTLFGKKFNHPRGRRGTPTGEYDVVTVTIVQFIPSRL
ncbi:MAG: hypothetical protein WCF33_05855 [Pseudonocardiaceae bacterium]